MHKTRLEAFSDGVLAILITIMVLELRAPHGAAWADLRPLLPTVLCYALSFLMVGIYWNNHHHLLQAAQKVNGHILWANMHLLFWLSLVPFVTSWMAENPFAARPVALYGAVLWMCGLAYYLLVRALLAHHGAESTLARAIGRDVKGKLSVVVYTAAIALAFWSPRLSILLFVAVALIWLVPDLRIEKTLER
jgi:uncharacterized membrane protein